jgi:hypothetical protein
MVSSTVQKRWRPTGIQLVAGGLVLAGLFLTSVNWWFILLSAAGTFGPGILRELGVLADRDEFQRQAVYRAGYHAFLTTGLAAFVLIAFFRSAERSITDIEELATLLLVILWCTWFLSWLLDYWGPQKTAARILVAFGSAWLLFAIASNVGAEWTGWGAFLLSPLITLPFFGLAWLSRLWPRIAGVLLLAVCIFYLQFFGFLRASHLGPITRVITFVLLVGPLLASGVSLLAAGKRNDTMDDTLYLPSGMGTRP